MAEFRKRPVTVTAEQWFPDHPVAGVQFSRPPLSTGPARWWIDTLEGWHEVSAGDWIITGVNGERYPCKPDIFSKTYDRAAPPTFEQYEHHGTPVWVRTDLKGRHRELCLCYACAAFHPGQENHCRIAGALYALDRLSALVTPVFECPAFVEA